MIRTTVIIPVYNGSEYIEDCLNSVLRSKTRVKVIVVDNGSVDESCSIIEEKYKEVELIRFEENKGFSAAVNAGIVSSRTEFVFLLNDDAIIEPDTIGLLEKDMDLNPKIFSVQAKMLKMYDPSFIDSAGDNYCALGWAYDIGKDKPADKYKGVRAVFASCAGAAMYRKSIFKKIGYFDNIHFAYLEDVDIGYRALIHGYLNYADMRAKVFHVGSGTSGSRYNEFKVSLSARNSVYLIYKNMPLLQIVFNLPMLILGYLVKTVFFFKKGMGGAYITGLLQGFALCLSKKGRQKKVDFLPERLPTYIAIQVLLIVNVLRRFI